MKNTLLFIFLILGFILCRAQTLNFSYDSAGNQVLRIYQYDGPTMEDLSLFELSEMIVIYPNPTSGVVYIDWGVDMMGMIRTITIQAYNASYSQTVETNGDEHSAQFDITPQPAGLYFTRFLLIDDRVITKTLIKY